MKLIRKKEGWLRISPGLMLFCLLSFPALAQNARLRLDALEKLSSKATEVNDLSLDGPLLQLAAKFMDVDQDPESAQIKEMIKNLQGIYIKNFEFDKPDQYSAADVAEIRTQLSAPGWSKIIQNGNRPAGELNEIYVMKDGNKVAGVAILVVEPKELTVVNIVGPVDLDKLDELSGRFGAHISKDPSEKPSPKSPSGKK